MLSYRRFPLSKALPSWWLALWVLLLVIFCSSLFPESEIASASGIKWPVHPGGLCEGGIIQLSMPALKAMPKAKNQLTYDLLHVALHKLEKARRWQTVTFTGNGINDFICIANTRQYVQFLNGNSWREAGIRIRFGPATSYACLMEVLNMLSIWGDHKYYWLDVRHNLLTIYVVLRPPEIALNQ